MDVKDVDNFVSVRCQADADRLRARLLRLIFKEEALPGALPEFAGDCPPPIPGLAGAAHCGLWRAREAWFTSYLHRAEPARPSGRNLILHNGHFVGYDNAGYRGLVEALLARGWSVTFLDMPGLGLCEPKLGPDLHNTLGSWQTADFNPLRAFAGPAAQAVNLAAASGASLVAMAGVSGGGWATTLSAALDVRISLSLPVAGSLPLWLRPHPADWEQDNVPADYLDLYLLGCDRGRRQTQVLNLRDPCCFWGDSWRAYRGPLGRISDGRFDLYCDEANADHSLSPQALRCLALPFLNGDPMQPQIADESSPASSAEGLWTPSDQGYAGSCRFAPPQTSSFRWSLSVPAAREYGVYATWTPHANRATNALFRVGEAAARVNQRTPVWDLNYGGANWKLVYRGPLPAGPLSVLLTNEGADGYVIADAVLLAD